MVTGVTVAPYRNRLFLFSGGEDQMVRVWDLDRHRGMFQLDVGDGRVPLRLHFKSTEKTLEVLTRPADGHEEQVPQLQTYQFIVCPVAKKPVDTGQ
jgi:hypothetical protein